MIFKAVNARFILSAVICGVLLSLITRFLERNLIGILEITFYGYPIIWRVTNLNRSTEYVLINFTIDIVVWIVVFMLFFFLIQWGRKRHMPFLNGIHEEKTDVNVRLGYTFWLYFLVLAFLMKVAGEFVHEVVGHGLFVILFGGRIIRVTISLLWPYRLSGIGISGNFEVWQQPWIDGGGILVCLTASCILQVLLLWKVKSWQITVPLFWLAFWTFLNPTGYLVIGGIIPFGDIFQLIAEGILSKTSSLIMGLILFVFFFFSLSRIFTGILYNTGLIQSKQMLRVFLSFQWLTIPFVTLMAILGLGFLSSYSLLLFPLSLIPSIASLLLPEYLLSITNFFS